MTHGTIERRRAGRVEKGSVDTGDSTVMDAPASVSDEVGRGMFSTGSTSVVRETSGIDFACAASTTASRNALAVG
jgi:hypothetical protein